MPHKKTEGRSPFRSAGAIPERPLAGGWLALQARPAKHLHVLARRQYGALRRHANGQHDVDVAVWATALAHEGAD
jgi:hypothetical protein